MLTKTIKTWTWVHKWSSIVCTAFMLLLCVTGLPLIFHHEIGHLLGTEIEAPPMAENTPRTSLDKILDVARAQHPDRVVQFVSQAEDDDRIWFVTMTPTAKLRALVVPQGRAAQAPPATEAAAAAECEVEPAQAAPRRIGWARLLKRVFDIDMQHCPNCGASELKIISAILGRPVIEKILTHLGLDPQPPPRGRARQAAQD